MRPAGLFAKINYGMSDTCRHVICDSFVKRVSMYRPLRTERPPANVHSALSLAPVHYLHAILPSCAEGCVGESLQTPASTELEGTENFAISTQG